MGSQARMHLTNSKGRRPSSINCNYKEIDIQGHREELMEGCFYFRFPSPSLPFPRPSISLPSPPLSYPFPFLPFPSLPLRSRAPLSQLGGLGSAVSFPSGVWGGPTAKNVFGVLLSWQKATGGNHFEYYVK